LHTVNIRVTHKKADIPTLEAVSFPDTKKAVTEICALPSVKECVIIQTCNRVEIFAASEDLDLAYHEILDYVMEQTISKMKRHLHQSSKIPPEDLKLKGENDDRLDQSHLLGDLLDHIVNSSKKFHDVIETDYHTTAVHHLLRLTSGLESMLVGEDQILGQVRDSYKLSVSANTAGPFFKNIFTKAINVGKRARRETDINKGAVSIGSAAVELARQVLGTLEGKNVLLVGAGEMGTLIARSISEHEPGSLVVANRTLERSERIAKDLGASVLKFCDIEKGIAKSDLVITATSAPKILLTRETIEESVKKGRNTENLVIIDVSIPRAVDQGVSEIPGVDLLNIDSLKEIAEKNRHLREMEAIKVEEILEEETALLIKQVYRIDVEEIVKAVFRKAEHIRQKELEKALHLLGNGIGEKEKAILDDLTRVIVNRTMFPITEKIKMAAETGDRSLIENSEKLFIRELRHKF